jgi:tRNA-uridine 2-sulfurtransferase
VPFYLLDAREAFQEVVIDPFVPSYEAGRDPEPVRVVQPHIKFGDTVAARAAARLQLRRDRSLRAPGRGSERGRVAPGRRRRQGPDVLPVGAAARHLPYLLFPLGEMTKAEVRRQAVERGLSVAWKRSSSGSASSRTRSGRT